MSSGRQHRPSDSQALHSPDPDNRSSRASRQTTLFLASSNPGKLREFSDAAALRNVKVLPLPGFAKLAICVEDGTSFEENTRKKAVHYSRGFSGWVFADDSGICVDALGGAPGIYSARFAGLNATDKQNNERLLADLHQVESLRATQAAHTGTAHNQIDRSAHYICAIALAQAGQVVTVVEGRVDGIIIDEPRGSGGFGYDPYFFYPPLGRTLAETSSEEKFTVSHRGAAFRKLLDYLDARGR